jgi:hypothetical protein
VADLDPRSDRAKASHKLLLRVLRSLPEDYEPWGQDKRDDPVRPCADCSCGCVFFNELSGQLGADWGVCMNPESHRAGLLTWEHQGCHQFRFDEALESDEIEPCGCEESEALRAELAEAKALLERLAADKTLGAGDMADAIDDFLSREAQPAAPEPSAEPPTAGCHDAIDYIPGETDRQSAVRWMRQCLAAESQLAAVTAVRDSYKQAAQINADAREYERAAHAETRKALEEGLHRELEAHRALEYVRVELAKAEARVEKMRTALECARPHCVNTSVEDDIDEVLRG